MEWMPAMPVMPAELTCSGHQNIPVSIPSCNRVRLNAAVKCVQLARIVIERRNARRQSIATIRYVGAANRPVSSVLYPLCSSNGHEWQIIFKGDRLIKVTYFSAMATMRWPFIHRFIRLNHSIWMPNDRAKVIRMTYGLLDRLKVLNPSTPESFW